MTVMLIIFLAIASLMALLVLAYVITGMIKDYLAEREAKKQNAPGGQPAPSAPAEPSAPGEPSEPATPSAPVEPGEPND